MGAGPIAHHGAGGMARHPSIRDRRLVVVGSAHEAHQWALDNAVDINRTIIADSPRRMVTLNPEQIHIVVMPGFLNWRDPTYFMLRTEIAFMHGRGATLEWG